MKYLTYEYQGAESYGVLTDGGVYPVPDIIDGAPATLAGFIEAGLILGASDATKAGARAIPLKDVTLKAPIPYPRRDVICLGKNYEDHVKEIKTAAGNSRAVPQIPVYFGKSAAPAIGCGQMIPPHSGFTAQIDYEVELAVIIGKVCDNISEDDVCRHIFGYTVLNDVSARDVQAAHEQWYLGKSLAGFCPMGPVICDTSDIPDPTGLRICSRVNGEPRQDSNTRMMIFSIPFVISQLSRGLKLYPGDIISTGTPAGVGHAYDPPRHLKTGDTVECEIERIGILKNTVG